MQAVLLDPDAQAAVVAIDFVACDPRKRHLCRHRALDRLLRQLRLGLECDMASNLGCLPAFAVLNPFAGGDTVPGPSMHAHADPVAIKVPQFSSKVAVNEILDSTSVLTWSATLCLSSRFFPFHFFKFHDLHYA